MLDSLNRNVIQRIKSRGFSGRYPHFRKDCGEHIELVSFFTNKYGGSFTVELSAAFPNCAEKNYSLFGNMNEKTLNVSATNNRYRLPGMFDGWFYYSDVYCKSLFFFGKIYSADHELNEKRKGWSQVQTFNESTADDICVEINKQMIKGFEWLEKFVSRHNNKARV